MTVLFLVALLALVGYFVARQLIALFNDMARSQKAANKATAKEALDHRHANGEVTREEYLKIKDDITQNMGNRDA